MNQNQKWVLVAIITIIVAMLLYPPFQLSLRNGVIYNMGYGWLFEPPRRGAIAAIVNVSMLLIQWFAVLVVGCLAFFLAKNQSKRLSEVSFNPPNQNHSNIASTDKIANTSTEPLLRNISVYGSTVIAQPKSSSFAIIDQTQLGFFGRCWYGKERLWKAFWLLGLLAAVIFKLTALSSLLVNEVLLVSLPVQLFCWVSVWRCAFRTSHWFWAIVARCWVVVSITISFVLIVASVGSM